MRQSPNLLNVSFPYNSPSKPSKYLSSTTTTAMKDRRAHRAPYSPPKDDSNRKRTFDAFEERHSRSDSEDKHRKSNKRGDDSVEDLRKHLLKKSDAKLPQQTNSRDERARGNTSGERERGREREKRKETVEQTRTDSKVKSYSNSRSEYERYVESTKNSRENSYDIEHKKKTSLRGEGRYRDSSDDVGESHKALKDKSKYKRSEDNKLKKKKRRKHKDSDSEFRDDREKTSSSSSNKQIELEKSPVAKEENLSYDDITSSSDSSPAPLAKSPESLSSASHRGSDKSPSPSSRSVSRSPSLSVSRSPSRSPSPQRSPTPVKKRTYFPAIEGCRSVEEFVWLNRIEEGTYGVVYRAKDRNTGKYRICD